MLPILMLVDGQERACCAVRYINILGVLRCQSDSSLTACRPPDHARKVALGQALREAGSERAAVDAARSCGPGRTRRRRRAARCGSPLRRRARVAAHAARQGAAGHPRVPRRTALGHQPLSSSFSCRAGRPAHRLLLHSLARARWGRTLGWHLPRRTSLQGQTAACTPTASAPSPPGKRGQRALAARCPLPELPPRAPAARGGPGVRARRAGGAVAAGQ